MVSDIYTKFSIKASQFMEFNDVIYDNPYPLSEYLYDNEPGPPLTTMTIHKGHANWVQSLEKNLHFDCDSILSRQ